MNIKFEKVNNTHIPNIIKLHNKYFYRKISSDEINIKFYSNPINKIYKQINYGYVAMQGQNIIGYLGCIPQLYYYKNKQILTYVTNSLICEKGYESIASMLCLKFIKDNQADIFLNTTANKSASKIFKAIGFSEFGDEKSRIIKFSIMNYNQFYKYYGKENVKRKFLIFCYSSFLKYLAMIIHFIIDIFNLNKIIYQTDKVLRKKFYSDFFSLKNSNFNPDYSLDYRLYKYNYYLKNKKLRVFTIKKENRIIASCIGIIIDEKTKLRICEIYYKKKFLQ